jgi:hypothetical protein
MSAAACNFGFEQLYQAANGEPQNYEQWKAALKESSQSTINQEVKRLAAISNWNTEDQVVDGVTYTAFWPNETQLIK